MHAILLWFDYLPYGVPGCCGNTEARTPGFDRFAAGSVTFDNCFLDDRRGESGAGLVEALSKLREAGVRVRVLSVHPTQLVSLLAQQADTDSDRAIDVEMLDDDDQLMQRLRSAADEAFDKNSDADREQQPAVTVASLPGVVTAEGEVIEELLESADRLLDRLALVGTGEQTLLLVSAGGAHVSAEPGRELDERLIHVPLLGRSGPPLEFGWHSPSLVSQSDVANALLHRAGLPIEESGTESTAHAEALLRELSGERRESRPSLIIEGPDGTVGVRTREWYLTTRLEAAAGADLVGAAVDRAALYVKPGDLWDRLDVASQSPGVVEELVGMLPAGAGKSGARG
jgi:hypothetical protein